VAEEQLFQRRYENGYNLTHDKRYNLWLTTKDTVSGRQLELTCTNFNSRPNHTHAGEKAVTIEDRLLIDDTLKSHMEKGMSYKNQPVARKRGLGATTRSKAGMQTVTASKARMQGVTASIKKDSRKTLSDATIKDQKGQNKF